MTNDRWLDLALDPKQRESVAVEFDVFVNVVVVDVDVMDPDRMKKRLVVNYEDVVDDAEETSTDFGEDNDWI